MGVKVGGRLRAVLSQLRGERCADAFAPLRRPALILGSRHRPVTLLRSYHKWERQRTGSVSAVPRADYENPPKSLRSLGRALRALREDRGLKQIEVATAAGTTESQVSDIERAQNNPGWVLTARLLDGMNADVADLADAYARAERGELD